MLLEKNWMATTKETANTNKCSIEPVTFYSEYSTLQLKIYLF